MPPEHGNEFHENRNDAGANTADEEIVQKTLFSPNFFQIPAKHPKHEHVHEDVEQPAMKKNVRYRLPDAQAGNNATGNQAEFVDEPSRNSGGEEELQERLQKEYARADENEKFHAGCNEPTPVETDARGVVGRAHKGSVKGGAGWRQKVDEGEIEEEGDFGTAAGS